MATYSYRFALTLTLSWVYGSSAMGGEFQKRFDGPYRITITITETRRVSATVRSAYLFPSMFAQEWWVAYPLPPEFPGQCAARGRRRHSTTSHAITWTH